MVNLEWGVSWDDYVRNPGTNQTFLTDAMQRGISWAVWRSQSPRQITEPMVHGQLFESAVEAVHTGADLLSSFVMADVAGFSTKKNREKAGRVLRVDPGADYQGLYEQVLSLHGRQLVSRYMWESTGAMLDRCIGVPIIADLLFNSSASYQGVVSGPIDDCGLFKGRIDVGVPTAALSDMTRMELAGINPGFLDGSSFTLVDIKTTVDSSPHKNGFPKSAGKYDYFFQLAFYCHLLRAALGVAVNPVIVAVEKPEIARMPIDSGDINVVVYPLGSECLEALDEKVGRALALNREYINGVVRRGFRVVNKLVPPAYYSWGD